ncbi:sigma-E factor negative regulatory protein [Arenimonas alkanexedens]
MTEIDTRLKEQLSAWLDGELPADEARFLQRRLDNDPALRGQFERWQLASACLRGQPVRLMPGGFAASVQAAVVATSGSRARWPWAAAAAVLVAVLLPNLMAPESGPGLPPSAQLAGASAPALVSPIPALAQAALAPSSPLTSVRDFPLSQPVGDKPWPRSPLLSGDRSLQALLVRHNNLAAGGGVGGFMANADVATQDAEAGAATADAELARE